MAALGNIGKFVGGNFAAAAMFMLANKLLEPVMYGSPEGAQDAPMAEGGSGVDEDQLMQLLAAQSRARRPMSGGAILDDFMMRDALNEQKAATAGQALGSAYRAGGQARYMSPELETLLTGYEGQLENLGAMRPRSYAQVMAELGEF